METQSPSQYSRGIANRKKEKARGVLRSPLHSSCHRVKGDEAVVWAGGVDRPTYIYIFCDHKKATKKAILGPPAITSNTHILLYRYEVIKLSLNMLLIYIWSEKRLLYVLTYFT